MNITKKLILSSAISMAMLSGGYNYAMAAGTTTAQEITANKTVIKATPSHIEIYVPGDEPVQVTIYALTGQVVKSLTAEPSATTYVELRAGYYIVKCDRHTQQVVVR